VKAAGEAFLARLDAITIEDLCQAAETRNVFDGELAKADFTI
jgi:hypothetical protein